MKRGLTAGAFFRGCVDRSGRILSVDETATATGRAGQSLLELVVAAEHPAVVGLLADRTWTGLRALNVTVPGHAGPTVLVALATRRLVDVALLMLRTKEDLLLARDFQQLFEASEHGVWAFAADETPLFTNARMARLLHCGPQDLLLRPKEFLTTDEPGKITLHRSDGGILAADISTVAIRTAGMDELGTLVLADDAQPPNEDLRFARARLHDPLTGLPNRAYLAQHLTGAPANASPAGFAIVLCNLRGFAMFNKQYGGARADQLLGAVADRLRQLVKPPQFLARLNKDEFVVSCPSVTSAERAQKIADRLSRAFAALVTFDDIDYQARLSCGVAFRPGGRPVDLEALVAEAARTAR